MDINIVKIGNSQGIRIPKAILKQTGLKDRARMRVENGVIIIEPDELSGRDLAIMSERSLEDWNSPEEDEAWAHLQ